MLSDSSHSWWYSEALIMYDFTELRINPFVVINRVLY